MINNPKIIEEINQKLKKTTKEQLENAIKQVKQERSENSK